MWPARSSICLDCRTALPEGQPCPVGHRRVRALHDPGGREALLGEVWGPPSVRAQLRQAAGAGVTGSSGLSLLDGCSGCDVFDAGDGHFWLVLMGAFLAITVLWLVGRWAIRRVRAWRRHRVARGARRAGPRSRRPGAVGTVVATRTAPDPITGRPCVAFGATLRGPRRDVMLRDGATLGFEIALDTGERVVVPAGGCAIDESEPVAAPGAAIPEYLAAIDSLRATVADLEPFPGDDLRVCVLRPGDRVELHGPLVPAPDAAPRLYRDAGAVRAPEALPCLRRL